MALKAERAQSIGEKLATSRLARVARRLFNMTVTFGGAPCGLPGQSVRGLRLPLIAPSNMVPWQSAPGEGNQVPRIGVIAL